MFSHLTSRAPDWVRCRHMTFRDSVITLDAVGHVLCDAQEARHQRHVHGVVPWLIRARPPDADVSSGRAVCTPNMGDLEDRNHSSWAPMSTHCSTYNQLSHSRNSCYIAGVNGSSTPEVHHPQSKCKGKPGGFLSAFIFLPSPAGVGGYFGFWSSLVSMTGMVVHLYLSWCTGSGKYTLGRLSLFLVSLSSEESNTLPVHIYLNLSPAITPSIVLWLLTPLWRLMLLHPPMVMESSGLGDRYGY